MFWSESGEKSASDQAAFTRQNSSKQICVWIFDVRDNSRCTLSLRKSYYELWTQISVKNILMLDLFQLLSSPDVNWWTGVLWIIVMFLSDSHSDGTHSLQSIHCWDTDAETHFYKSNEETNSSWSQIAWGWAHVQHIFVFGWTIPLIWIFWMMSRDVVA